MDQSNLSSRAIMGMYYRALEQDTGVGWVDQVSNLFNSDQPSETYEFLGQVPQMREWLGGRDAKSFNASNFEIVNKHYESTIQIAVKDARRDKTGQLRVRMADQAQRAQGHWAELLGALIVGGEAATCYDGQFFFDTDHVTGDSGSQSNDIQADISGYPVENAGTVTAPSAGEVQWAVMEGITKILGFVDDQGQPMNENASSFLVMCPLTLQIPMQTALTALATRAMTENINANFVQGITVNVVGSARLSSWTDKFAVIRTDSNIKPFIRQQETGTMMKAKAEGSDFEFDNDAWEFGIDTWRNVGYGMWEHACLVTMI